MHSAHYKLPYVALVIKNTITPNQQLTGAVVSERDAKYRMFPFISEYESF